MVNLKKGVSNCKNAVRPSGAFKKMFSANNLLLAFILVKKTPRNTESDKERTHAFVYRF